MIPDRSSLFQYSILALPLAFAGLPLYVHAPDFYARDLGVSIGLIGGLLLFIRLFDAFQDPFIGYISDRHPRRRYAIMSVGVLFLIAGMGLIFYGPSIDLNILLCFTAGMLIATTGFSIVSINLTMIGGFWSPEIKARTHISAWREAFSLSGLLIASILPAWLQQHYSSKTSFTILFCIFCMVMFAAFFIFSNFMKTKLTHDLNNQLSEENTGFSFLTILFGPNRRFFVVCFLSHLAAALPAVLVLFFIRDFLEVGNLSGLFLFLYFISGAALIGVWVKLAAKIGKHKAWFTSMLLSIVTFIWAYTLLPGDTLAYSAICILSGIALGADLALPPSILADRITVQNSESHATQFYALLAFIPKFTVAVASGLGLMILHGFGFNPGTENSAQALQTLVVLYALIPCLIKLIAALLLWQLINSEGENCEVLEKTLSTGVSDVS